MAWSDGWPLIGQPGAKPGVGNPVASYRKPVAGHPVKVPATSDEFSGTALGLQWQWNANPQEGWYSLAARPGYLRLPVLAAPQADGYVRAAPNILAQKLPAAAFTVDTRVELNGAAEGGQAGLILNGMSYAWLGLRKLGADTQLVYTTCTPFAPRCKEQSTVLLAQAPSALSLRMVMAEGAQAQFLYSVDGKDYLAAGAPFAATKGHWVGAQVGLFSAGPASAGYLDVDYFRLTR
jgi:beta-xylosidase